jgi:hypothetical protein
MSLSTTLALALYAAFALPVARAGGPADVAAWVRAAGVHPAASGRVLAWVDDDERATAAFAASFPGWVQRGVAASVSRRLPGAVSGCASSVRVRFVEPGTVGKTDGDHSFERSTFGVESLHCLDKGDAAQAISVYNTASFREAVMPGLESYWRKGDDVCIATGAVTGILDRTETCSATREYTGEGVRAFHTRLVESADAPDAQGVFLRESLVAFVDREEGGVAVFRVVYTRGKDMGALQRSILGRVAGTSQDKIAAALEKRLH